MNGSTAFGPVPCWGLASFCVACLLGWGGGGCVEISGACRPPRCVWPCFRGSSRWVWRVWFGLGDGALGFGGLAWGRVGGWGPAGARPVFRGRGCTRGWSHPNSKNKSRHDVFMFVCETHKPHKSQSGKHEHQIKNHNILNATLIVLSTSGRSLVMLFSSDLPRSSLESHRNLCINIQLLIIPVQRVKRDFLT